MYSKQYSAFIFEWIFFVLAGNKDTHERLNEYEFEIKPGPTTDYGVSCPVSDRCIIVPLVLIVSSSFLQDATME